MTACGENTMIPCGNVRSVRASNGARGFVRVVMSVRRQKTFECGQRRKAQGRTTERLNVIVVGRKKKTPRRKCDTKVLV